MYWHFLCNFIHRPIRICKFKLYILGRYMYTNFYNMVIFVNLLFYIFYNCIFLSTHIWPMIHISQSCRSTHQFSLWICPNIHPFYPQCLSWVGFRFLEFKNIYIDGIWNDINESHHMDKFYPTTEIINGMKWDLWIKIMILMN
jgi:hypothetical protein